ncbi:CPBP family intramembrane glutamic endopeptidase [Staphylococcus delphini]|uniref:CPBP family intramembrane glutamic endopeptidase n=1 Tax=Staphylococcus delphini TaxID=53344 RepID=UPI0021D123D5|nr:type II CAAX endopeptidase family protein [Staphylococcus delphini]UXS21748.1 CPBP family intramembrane metalloprotease [Staphylococcus delphini]UXS57691.1 CPBP family intramembrane metalloprotease [Staphylococcus delphini]
MFMNFWRTLFKILGLILLMFVISVFAQNIAISWHLLSLFGFEYVLHGLTYVVVALFLIKLIANKMLKRPLSYFRITSIRIFPSSMVLGVLLATLTIVFYFVFVPGHFSVTHVESTKAFLEMIFELIILGGIAAPIVEEVVFRGVLLKYIEEKTNIVVAMVITSVFFAMVHLFNGRLTGIDFYLLIIGGTMVGMLYAIAAYRYNSIWASVVLHMCWNIGSIITISPTQTDVGWIQYVINSHNVWLTGGAYGFSVSLVAIIGYMVTAIVILFLKKDRHF